MIGRRMIAAGVVALAVGAGGVAGAVIGIPGLSGASSSSPTADTSPLPGGHELHRVGGLGAGRDVLAAAAKALNLSTPALLQKLSDGKTTIADVATQQKVDLSSVIAAMENVADSDISNLVNNPLPVPFKGPVGGSGFVPPDFPGPPGALGFGFGFRAGFGPGGSIDSVAKALGISSRELLADLRSGQSIAAIAKSKHVDLNTIINTLVTDATARINAAVKAGDLDQARATKVEGMLKDEITNMVNRARPDGFGGAGSHFGRFGFGRGGPGPMGPGSVAPSASAAPGSAAAT